MLNLIDDYKPGYLYRIVKIHESNNPLCPIISKIPTPIYELTKTIKQLITPYLPSKYNKIIHTLKPNNGVLASLDVENLSSLILL